MKEFSFRTRNAEFKASDDRIFDVLVIGGGIIGAGICNALSQSGISTILVDMGDFASGTSSGSSKLIHGGLRYLAQGRIGLTRKLLKERNYLAKHTSLVKKSNFDILIGKGLFGKREIRFGLFLYRLLGGGKASGFIRNTGKYPKSVDGYYTYVDCITDDARLTVRNIVEAHENGAVCLNYVKYVSSEETDNIHTSILRDQISGEQISVASRYIVNAAGPWVGSVSSGMQEVDKRIRLSKGIHLILPSSALDQENAVVFKSQVDQRQMFLIPRDKVLILGTTDDFVDTPDNFDIKHRERLYILESSSFLSDRITVNNIIGEYAGIRTLFGEGDDPGKLSRDFSISVSGTTAAVVGGKVTDYRRVAHKVASIVSSSLSTGTVSHAAPEISDGIVSNSERISAAIMHECAVTEEDIIRRRTGTFYFDPEGIEPLRIELSDYLQSNGIDIDPQGFFRKQ